MHKNTYQYSLLGQITSFVAVQHSVGKMAIAQMALSKD